jgi:hypothetical protein
MQLKAARPHSPNVSRHLQWRIVIMNRVVAFLSRLMRNEWREIGCAPFDREIEVATIGKDITVAGGPCLRHGDGWLDAETLRPLQINATHWRYRWPAMPPMSCC